MTAVRPSSGVGADRRPRTRPRGPPTDPAFDGRLLAPALLHHDRPRTTLAAAQDGLEAEDRIGALTAAEQEIPCLRRVSCC
ncbi:hypothetical protein [Streptomyces canus]|uniref:hypothetical protein n=1 Tax=Streptomyces canus TaxID=58343 RepID=UPI002E3442B1|nr:hypothetical protein [Streptomyces canus]